METKNITLPDLDELLADLDDYISPAAPIAYEDDENAELAEWEKGYWLDVCGSLM